MYHNFFIHSSASGHLGCFCVLAVVNSAAVNIGVHVSFQLWFPEGIYPAVQLLGHMVVFFFFFFPSFLKNLHTVPYNGCCIPTNSAGGFPFLHTLSSIYRL